MDSIPEKREMFYEGKAKKLYTTNNPDLIIQYFKDDATAFNGKKKDTIEDKGVVNNRMSELFLRAARTRRVCRRILCAPERSRDADAAARDHSMRDGGAKHRRWVARQAPRAALRARCSSHRL